MTPTTAQLQNGKITLSQPIAFNNESTALTPESAQTLTDLLDVVKGYPAIGSIQIDSLLGSGAPAIREQRAELIQQLAQEQGVASSNLIYNVASGATSVQEVPIVHVRENMQNGLYVIQSFGQ